MAAVRLAGGEALGDRGMLSGANHEWVPATAVARARRSGVAAGLWVALASAGFAQQVPAPQASTPADDSAEEGAPLAPTVDRLAAHGQMTFLEQLTAPFHDPYNGPNSLTPRQGAETFDATLFLGARLWTGAEAWANPEIDQGFGLDNTVGVAGYPSGTAYKVGRSHPYWRLPRLFVRQTVNLGEENDPVEAAPNQFGGPVSADRCVFTIGKFAVTDIFDANPYAHDPRSDFLNWTVLDAGSFDYAAESWGYTVGAAAEWYRDAWTLRAGVFDLSDVPNSESLEHGLHEIQWVGEIERRYALSGHAGSVLMTVFDSRGRMALLDQALSLAQQTGEPIGATLIDARQYRARAGVSVDLSQQLSPELGVFARVGRAGGNVEVYEFTDVDQTVSAGLSLKGRDWGRAADTVGLAAMVNRISGEREAYLNAGGLGILVGDGQLPKPGPEQIAETYYEWGAVSWATLTLDYQYVINPAYNTQRGPVSLVALRAHAQF